MKKLKRAGITIAEMCIVLAVLAVASTVIVSFSLMASARASASVSKLNAQDDIKVSRTFLESWIDQMHSEGAYVNAESEKLHAVISNGENAWEYNVYQQGDFLIAELPDGEQRTCPLDAVKQFRFQQLPEETVDRNVLYFCTVVYSAKSPVGDDVVFEETFTIRPRVGQSVTP